MHLDKYSNPIFNEHDLFDALYKGYQMSPGDLVFVDDKTPNILKLEERSEIKLFEPINSPTLTVEQLDTAWQEQWNMPPNYKTMDIEQWVLKECPLDSDIITRVSEELEAYKERNMLDLLRWLKYFVDTCSKNNIVWGIGRGSSVASYILYLIGVHSIDSIRYNLDWREFLR